MSTVLIYTSPASGHLYPVMDVALALREAGHRVVVQTLTSELETVHATGLETRPIHPAIEAANLEDYRGGSPLVQFQITLDTWLGRAPYEIEDLRAAIDELDPDLLVVDANTWGAAAFSEARGGPWAMFLPYCLPVPSPDVPAFGPGFPPPRGLLGRLRDRVVGAVMDWSLRDAVRRHAAFRTAHGASSVRHHYDHLLRAPALLYRTAPPFDYPRRDWPETVHPIGPGLWAPPGEAPAWLRDLPHPRVLVTVSTELQHDGAIVQAALDGLADEPGSVIVTTAALDPESFEAHGDHVRIERFLPHAAVVPHVDVVVTHGGMGTTQRALAAGVPLCVVPWGRDQSESAQRVVTSGAGVRLDKGRLEPRRLRDAVRAARACQPAAERVAVAFREAGGAARAVDLLEGLLAGHHVAHPTGELRRAQ